MLLLSPAIDKKTIRWKEHLKGRLVQASFSWHGARVHVLVAYQHVWSSQKGVHQNKEDRAKLLGSLASALRAIPARDTLLLAGDFNTHSQRKYGGQGRILPTICGIPQTGSAQYLEQRSWSHLCAGRRTNSNRLHLHLPQLVPRTSEASQASPSIGIGWVEEGRAYSHSCDGTASPALDSPKNRVVLLRIAPPLWRRWLGS